MKASPKKDRKLGAYRIKTPIRSPGSISIIAELTGNVYRIFEEDLCVDLSSHECAMRVHPNSHGTLMARKNISEASSVTDLITELAPVIN